MNKRAKFKIEIVEPDCMTHDLGVKFAHDLGSLINRTWGIAAPVIGPDKAGGAIVSGLIAAGIAFERQTGAPDGAFAAAVDHLTKEPRK